MNAAPILPLIPRAPCPADDPLRVGVLVSGAGSNLQALLDGARSDAARYRVALVGSNVAGVRALERAAHAHVPSFVEDHRSRSREAFEDALHARLLQEDVELVVLAGFMRVLTASFLARWPRRVVNIHPALLPAFPGTHGVRQAFVHGARVSGCTVHLVDAGVDTGPILAQRAVPVLDSDTEETLAARVHAAEHEVYPRVVDAFARGLVAVDASGRVRASGVDPPGAPPTDS